MNKWDYPGAKWWKFDFHTHTPASKDFLQGCTAEQKAEVTAEYWLRKFMEEGLECVAITDHNSGAWIDTLKEELQKLAEDRPDWYQELTLFPGVEISAYGGVHLLAVFDPETSTSDIDALLGAVGYDGEKGTSDSVTTKSLTEVIDIIAKHGGIAIPAHADKKKGLFEQPELSGNTLKQVLGNPNIYAMELCDESYQKPQLYSDKKLNWTEVRGSDLHNFRPGNFGTFTWIKMDQPSIEGLKLAMIDGASSVNRNIETNPNQHAEFVIEALKINQAKYIGRAEKLVCRFSPFLNTVIGGRGSGKSTLLEFMRLVLRREDELPEILREVSQKYFNAGGEGDLLLEDSRLSLVYRKGETRYRLNWSAQAEVASLEQKENGNWEAVDGEIKSLFPVRIYSQKQIYELAENPQALIDIIDQAPEVGYRAAGEEHISLVNRYKQNAQKIQELHEKVAQKNRLKGELNDLNRQIEQIEKSGHKAVLQNYRQRQQQLNEIGNLESRWQEMHRQLAEMKDDIAPAHVNAEYFAEHADMLSALTEANNKWQTIGDKLNSLIQEAQSVYTDWLQAKENADWMQTLEADRARYKQLRARLEQQGIEPEKYPALLQHQKITKQELQQIDEYILLVKSLNQEQENILESVKQNRVELSEKRQAFLDKTLKDNSLVRIKINAFGEDWQRIEKNIRRILQCPDRFDRDIEHLNAIYSEEGIEALKETVLRIHKGEDAITRDARFARHLYSLPQESISDFMLWFPQDGLKITFGDKNQPIEQGSPGQKTAALLAFILSYGDEPLLLDQPEDDLDNALIYDLIVKKLHEAKSKRQIIVVTHNANIVVNGDAEMVLPLSVINGQSVVTHSASIQKEATREEICNILEGGQEAFKQRYKRIHLEKISHV